MAMERDPRCCHGRKEERDGSTAAHQEEPEQRRRSGVGEKGEGRLLPFIEQELWTCQTAESSGRCYSDNLRRRVLAFSA